MTELTTSSSVSNSIKAIDVVSRSSGYVSVVRVGLPFDDISKISRKGSIMAVFLTDKEVPRPRMSLNFD